MTDGTKIVTSYDDIINDPDIDCVVELMGGTTNAKDVVFRAIAAQKHIVTANKALIAEYLPGNCIIFWFKFHLLFIAFFLTIFVHLAVFVLEIQALLKANPSVKFCYEAAVCGGIPIIHTLQSDFLGDSISKIMGMHSLFILFSSHFSFLSSVCCLI